MYVAIALTSNTAGWAGCVKVYINNFTEYEMPVGNKAGRRIGESFWTGRFRDVF